MKERILVVPIGPGDPELLTVKTITALRGGDPVVMRTGRHPVSTWLLENHIPFSTLDALYEAEEDFDALYDSIARFLWQEAGGRHLIYAVPDPITDRSVDALFRLAPAPDAVAMLPGVSTVDLAAAAGRRILQGADLRVITASSLQETTPLDPNRPLLIAEVDSPLLAGDVKRILSDLWPEETEILYCPSLSGPASEARRILLYEADRQEAYSHLTVFALPPVDYAQRSRFILPDLAAIMETLRAPQGCPWDREQTHASLRPYLVEEAWEAVGAIDENEPDHLADELGDVLLQIVFHASIGRQFDEFTLTDVISGICRKMIQRHPHVFSDQHFDTASEVADVWETFKRRETGSRTVAESLNDVSPCLPALKYAAKVVKKSWQLSSLKQSPKALQQEMLRLGGQALSPGGVLNENVVGELLFRCAELCQAAKTDAELLLHETVDRFKKELADKEPLLQPKTKE